MKISIWKVAIVMGLVIAACFVPALEELDEEKGRECNPEHGCMDGYSCMEGHCQPEEGTACRPGKKAACGLDTGECQQGTRTCEESGVYGECVGAVQPNAENCNGKDDDCDGLVDEGLRCEDAGNTCAACTAAGRACASGECRGCLEGYFEQGEQCLLKLALGETCSSQGMCASGHCVDGVCCNGACEGPCESCDKTPGTCAPREDGSPGEPNCAPYRCDGREGRCPIECQVNEDCAPGVSCINQRCGEQHPPGEPCSGGEQCASGFCVGGFCCGTTACESSPGQCYQPSGTCSTGTCNYPPKLAGDACDDGNSCTVGDACNGSGTCTGSPKICNEPPSPCHESVGTCSGGNCVYALKPAGTACDDSRACTTGDACSSTGVCAGTAVVCNSPPSACYLPAGTCSSNGECSYTPKSVGTTCDDGNACTVSDACNGSGTCVGTQMICNSPPSQCHEATGTCANGTCSYALKPAGAACDDGNSCTIGDVCSSTGACAGASVTCNTPPSQCYESVGACSNGSCSYTPKVAGSACDDGDACTTNDRCNGSGVCVVIAISCDRPPSQCYQPTGTCTNGVCSYVPKPSGASCDDGNACTNGDTCNGSGSCNGTPVICTSPPGQCYAPTGTCSVGVCTYPPKDSGASCDDGNSCTLSDMCNGSGSCGGTPRTCNEPPGQCYEPAGTCSNGQCNYSPRPSGSTCYMDNACATFACNGAGACVFGGNISCPPVHIDSCSPLIWCDPSQGCVYDENWCGSVGGTCDGCCRDFQYRCIPYP
jgi:hypothetical protein